MNVPLLGQIPLVQSICEGSDKGRPVALEDSVSGLAFADLAVRLTESVNNRKQGYGSHSQIKKLPNKNNYGRIK